jgi:hypothetical protein
MTRALSEKGRNSGFAADEHHGKDKGLHPAAAPHGRNRHLAKMMSVKRGGMGMHSQPSMRVRRPSVDHGMGHLLPGLGEAEEEEAEGCTKTLQAPVRVASPVATAGGLDIDMRKQRNELAEVNAANAAMKADMERMKREVEEQKAAADAAQTQLKIAMKNARQARMDMNEKRKGEVGGGKGEEGGDLGERLKAVEEKLVDSNAAILKKEAELQFYKKKIEEALGAGTTGGATSEATSEAIGGGENGRKSSDAGGEKKLRKVTATAGGLFNSLTQFGDRVERKKSMGLGGKNITSIAAVANLKQQAAQMAAQMGSYNSNKAITKVEEGGGGGGGGGGGSEVEG